MDKTQFEQIMVALQLVLEGGNTESGSNKGNPGEGIALVLDGQRAISESLAEIVETQKNLVLAVSMLLKRQGIAITGVVMDDTVRFGERLDIPLERAHLLGVDTKPLFANITANSVGDSLLRTRSDDSPWAAAPDADKTRKLGVLQ
jgi:hypothetical protein